MLAAAALATAAVVRVEGRFAPCRCRYQLPSCSSCRHLKFEPNSLLFKLPVINPRIGGVPSTSTKVARLGAKNESRVSLGALHLLQVRTAWSCPAVVAVRSLGNIVRSAVSAYSLQSIVHALPKTFGTTGFRVEKLRVDPKICPPTISTIVPSNHRH